MNASPTASVHSPESLRHRSETVARSLPALLAEAEHLAATVLMGAHGRRRAGMGDEFWQYRPAQPGDAQRAIDWRRSARSDAAFVRETEWQAAQSVMLWLDTGAAMGYSGARTRPSKLRRAQTLALATAILSVRGGERVGLTHLAEPPKAGKAQLVRLATALIEATPDTEHSQLHPASLPDGARLVLFSDFLGPIDGLIPVLTAAADRGVRGCFVQILDPDEEAFPFKGRTVFTSMGGATRFETQAADGLRDAYQSRLAERRAELQELAAKTGWQFTTHHTDDKAEPALLWLYQALSPDAGR